MRLHCVAVVIAFPLCSALTLQLEAQLPLRVLRHAPVDTARSADVITISFDRPVVGSLDRTPDPARIVRVEPPLDARIQWRDPTTLRIIPREPIPPARRYRVTVSNNFEGLDGGRLEAPYEFTLVTRGPALLTSVPGLNPSYAVTLDPNAGLRLVYSAPIDTAVFARTARLEIAGSNGCPSRDYRYRVRSQREIVESDDWNIKGAGGWGPDTIENRFRRVVDLRAVDRPPEGCGGAVVLPSLDPHDRQEVRYPVGTQPTFTFAYLTCTHSDCAAGGLLRLMFSASVIPDSLRPRIHVEPSVPFTLVESGSAQTMWHIRLSIQPRTTYRVRIDSTLTDVFGRRITGSLERSVSTGDRHPALAHKLGFFSISRSNPVLRITHVNVDSAELVIVPIPDSLRATLLNYRTDPDSAARMVARLRDTVFRTVSLRAPFNIERVTDVSIPPNVRGGGLVAIRARRVEDRPATHGLSTDPSIKTRRPSLTPKLKDGEAIVILASAGGSVPSARPAIVQFTELMANAKVNDDGGAVLVTNASDGQPLAGATVTTRDERDNVIARGTTNTSGVADLTAAPAWGPISITLPPDEPYWARQIMGHARFIEVTRDGDRSLTPISATSWPDRTTAIDQLGGYLDEGRTIRAFVSVDRGIYRPGEKVYVTSTLRLGHVGDLRVPGAGDSVRLRVTHQQPGEREPATIRDTVLRLNAYGTTTDSFSLAPRLTLGSYAVQIDARLRSDWKTAGSASFELAEYRAAEFETSLALDSTARFLGDTLRARVSARYYFGAPMSGARIRWHVNTYDAPAGFPIPGLPKGFSVADGGGERPSRNDSNEGVDTLDASGHVVLRLPTSQGTSTWPAEVSVDVAVDDVNRQSVASSESRILHASNVYIAVRDTGARWYWRPNERRHVELLAVRPDGNRVTGIPIAITVLRRRLLIKEQTDGSSPNQRWIEDTLARDTVRSGETPASFDVTPKQPGHYSIVFTARDDRGRDVISSVGGYAIGGGWTPWGDNSLRLPVFTERDSLRAGDTLVVRFVSPFKRAEAWVTVEREDLLAQRRVMLREGDAVVRIPVTDRFIPGAHVSVLLVDSSRVWKADSIQRRIRVGYTTFAVDRSSKRLNVEIRSAQSVFAPGDSARITVTVRDRALRPVAAQVTLWAVDQGVVALTDYTVSDPLDAFSIGRATGLSFATTAKSIQSLARVLYPPSWNLDYLGFKRTMALSAAMAVGSPAANGMIVINTRDLAARQEFLTTAFYLGSLVTGMDGRVTAAVKLPDNITTYRVFAIAMTTDDRYGNGDSSFVVTKPLFARAALPRFLRAGDVFHAGAVVENTTSSPIDARATASGRGITQLGTTTAAMNVTRGRGTEARFDWRSDGSPGDSATFRFDVKGDKYADALEVTLPIRPPYAPRYHAVAGVARGEETIRMSLPSDIDPAKSRLTLRVGTSPLPLIRAAYARLSVYPYYCSEQLSSIGQTLLTMLRLQRAGVLDSTVAPDAATLRGRIQYVADELVRRQSRDGSIGYWTRDDDWTDVWLTSYAGTYLVKARDAGFIVDSQVIARIARFVAFDPDTSSWLKEEVYGTRQQREIRLAWRLSQELAALHFLQRAGVADTVLEDRMIEATPRMLWEDRVWLTELLGKRPDRVTARAQLARVWHDVEIAGTRVDIPDSLLRTLGFRSHVRPVARLYRATTSIDPNHPGLAALIERVVQQGRAELDWSWNTQDYAELVDALADLAIAAARAGPNPTVTVRSARADGRVLLSSSNRTGSDSSVTLGGLLERDGDRITLPVRITGSGAPVFYVLTVDEVPLAPPTTPDAQGIVVERWFERFDDGTPTNEVAEGDLVRGRLRITVPSDREFVAVEDLLPAGLEVVDLSLSTTSLGPFESAASREADRAGDQANGERSALPWMYGSWIDGWWSPWEHKEIRDDRVVYFARTLWKGNYTATYVARATTAGTFIRPPAHAEEMYNQSLGGRSEGGIFRIVPK